MFVALRPFARSGTVTRVAGTDRHQTAGLIADALPEPGPIDADTLDGQDATAFLRTDAAGDFLGVADTAMNSDRLGGVAADEYARTDDLAVPQTVVEFASCSGVGFFPVSASAVYAGIGSSSRFLTGSGDDIELLCPLHLPHGAMITEAVFHLTDSSPTRQIGVVTIVADAIDPDDGAQLVADSQFPITNDPGMTGDVEVTLAALTTAATTVDKPSLGLRGDRPTRRRERSTERCRRHSRRDRRVRDHPPPRPVTF